MNTINQKGSSTEENKIDQVRKKRKNKAFWPDNEQNYNILLKEKRGGKNGSLW